MSDTSLSDTKRVILVHAAMRKDHLILPVPDTIKAKGAALARILNSLIRQGYITERNAQAGEPVWSRIGDNHPTTLLVTDQGLAAIGIEIEQTANSDTAPTDSRSKTRRSRKAHQQHAASPTPLVEPSPTDMDHQPPALPFAPGSKSAIVTGLLIRKGGATLDELMAATGWQAHSVRGFLSGTLRKRHHMPVAGAAGEGGERRYRIAM